jgi:hypothetical protein
MHCRRTDAAHLGQRPCGHHCGTRDRHARNRHDRTSTSAPGKRALFRTVSGGAAEELAAPFGEGARFRWFILNNTVAHDTLPTDLEDLRGVQFVFPGESRRIVRMTGQVAKTPFTTSVFFQNRPN